MENSFEKIVTLVVILNVIAYLIKIVLKSKGYTVSWLYNHHLDFANIWKLLGNTKKLGERVLYFLLGTGYLIIIAIFLASAFLQVSNNEKHDPCVYQEKFRQLDWNGIVVKKYIDKTYHNLKTLEIEKNLVQTEKVQHWALFENGNFEKVEIGDSIVKKQGLLHVSLFKPDTVIQLDVDFGCEN